MCTQGFPPVRVAIEMQTQLSATHSVCYWQVAQLSVLNRSLPMLHTQTIRLSKHTGILKWLAFLHQVCKQIDSVDSCMFLAQVHKQSKEKRHTRHITISF